MPIDRNKPNIVQRLLCHGADAEAKDEERAYALSLALAESHNEVAMLLRTTLNLKHPASLFAQMHLQHLI